MCRRKPIPFTLEQNFLSRLPKLRAKRDGSSRRPPCGTAAPAGRSCLDSRGHSFVCGPAQGRGPPSRYLRVGLPPCPAGEAVLATYRQVRLLEESLEDRLRDLKEDTEGTIRLGMHIARARILVPPAAARFCREFPHVRLEVVHGDTAVLEDKLGQGTLHLFLGVDPEERPHFCFTPVGSETVYLVIAGALLDRCFPQGGAGDTIDETQLSRLPLIFSPTISKTQARITDFFRQHGLATAFQITAGDYDLQLRLAAQGLGACFCPAMHLRDVRHLLEGPEPILRRLYVPDLDVRNELKLVTNRRMYHPRYLDVFAGILEEGAALGFGRWKYE